MSKGLLIITTLAAFSLGTPAMAVEEPAFTRVLKDGAFEVRDYPGLVVAEVTVAGAQKEAANNGFRLLAGYIFGGNSPHEKIAMTAPVMQSPAAGQKIAMTAPVAQTPADGGWVVRFTMPSRYTLATLPAPADARVKLRAVPPARMAVLQFSGTAKPDDVQTKMSELASWIQAHRWHPTGPTTLAQYNPPWTLWFLRRNEVMTPIEK